MTTFNKEFDVVYLHCFDTTKKLGYTITYENLTEGIIKFKTKASFWSFGEKFEIRINAIDSKNTKVEFYSAYGSAVQLVDFVDKNGRNEKQFIELLTENLKK